MNRFFTSCYHLLWYATAIILILAAVLVTAARLALPGIGSYKDQIQTWVREYMAYPVVISEITADWEGWIPNLHLSKIDLYDQTNDHRIARFESANLGLDLLASLWQGRIIPSHLDISGLSLDLVRNVDGSISLRNQSMSGSNSTSGNQELADWLLNQRYIVLDHTSIDWTDIKTGKPTRHFEDVKIAVRTDGQRRQLDAEVMLPATYGSSLEIRADIHGNPLQTDWDGDVYIDATDMALSELLASMPISADAGTADIKLWTQWQDARLKQLSTETRLSGVALVATNNRTELITAGLLLRATRHRDDDWLLNIALQDIKTRHGLWPASTHELLLTRQAQASAYQVDARSSFLRLHDVIPLLLDSGLVTAGMLQGIDPLSIAGDLTDVEISSHANHVRPSVAFKGKLKQVAFSHTESLLSIAGLSGKVELDDNYVRLDLDSSVAELGLGKVYADKKQLQNVKGSLQLNRTEVASVDIQGLSLIAEDTPVQLSGRIELDPAAPYIDLVAHLGQTNIENLPSFLPLQTHPKLLQWAPKAIMGGILDSGDLVFRGSAKAFPFTDSDGVFKALLHVSDATFNYKDDWPYVDQLTAEILMHNDDLTVTTSSGYVFDATIDHAHATIPDISRGNHHIYIDGKLSGHTRNLPLFILQSPLQKNRGLYDFAQRQIVGSFDLDVKLDVPLDGSKSAIDGNIKFKDTMLESELPGLGLTDMNGDIRFNRFAAWGDNISALYHGKPVTINIPFDDKDDGHSQFIISGEADKVFIIQELGGFFPALFNHEQPFFKYFEGGSNWSVTINSHRDQNQVLNRIIEIDSSLDGIAVLLPEPLGKTGAEKNPLKVRASMSGNQINQIDFIYHDLLYTHLYVDNSDDFRIEKIEVDLGSDLERDYNSTEDVVVRGEVERLDLGEWFRFFKGNQKQKAGGNKPERSLRIALDVANLSLLNQDYTDTVFSVEHSQPEWQIGFDGADIRGQAVYSGSTPAMNDRLVLQFNHLKIHRQQETGNKQDKLDVNTIPDLDLAIDDFVFHDRQLGSAALKTTTQTNRMNIESLVFTKPDLNITINGTWQVTGDVNQTDLTTEIEAGTLAALMQTLTGEKANIDNGETNVRLMLNWMDTPVNFKMKDVNGQLDLKVGKGQLVDVDPSAGRLLGLLSVTTLPRRLSLDFSDLFNKGFAFDRIEGNFNLQAGQAYTNDLQMYAPSADISISGRTGYVTEDYDQIATVMPKITSSLPVASALFGPIGIGIGTAIFLAGEVFESIPQQINKIMSYQYSIQGSWTNPDIKRIEKNNPSG